MSLQNCINTRTPQVKVESIASMGMDLSDIVLKPLTGTEYERTWMAESKHREYIVLLITPT
jgi:hypothetical protein